MIASFPDFYFPEIPSAGKRVVVGLSGGVDSSVAAWILKEMGFDVLGVFMKNWEEDGDCPAKQDWIDAASAADCIGVEIDVVNFSQEYRDRVFESFLKEYASGRTPNPDILCNSEIKFRVFLDHAKAMGADLIATGHYAQVRACRGSNRDAFPDGAVLGECAGSGGRYFELLRGADANKDQSYFLYRLNQEQLSQVCFPVGHLSKKNVRYIAEKIGLPNAKKPDSTGICFIGERAFRAFLNQYLPYDPGPIVDEKGEVLGEHVGLAFYTLGQRQGLGIGGTRCGSGFPWFVSHKDREKNTLVVVQGREHPSLRKRYLLAEDAHWIAPIPTSLEAWSAKIRYRQEDAECQLTKVFSGGFHLQFFSPQWAVTPGQSVVLYRGTVCLGGGVIAAAHNELFVD